MYLLGLYIKSNLAIIRIKVLLLWLQLTNFGVIISILCQECVDNFMQ